jgi:glycosyltransferase involved in cell wall biosynthesis
VIAAITTTEAETVELNEPFLLGAWSTLACAVFAKMLRRVLGRPRLRFVSYAIENHDPRLAFRAKLKGIPSAITDPLVRVVTRTILASMDEVVFGSQGSLDNYRAVLGTSAVSRFPVVEALPARCECPLEIRDVNSCLFLGSFEDRKGIRELIASWEELSMRRRARLTLIGKGPLQAEVTDWARGRSDVDVIVDPPRALIHEALRRAHVLVLFSQPADGWREQIGLPILEALSHGCEVVTSTETGLAPWLMIHGHSVSEPELSSDGLAECLGERLDAADRTEEIFESLPSEDGRITADKLMMTTTKERVTV